MLRSKTTERETSPKGLVLQIDMNSAKEHLVYKVCTHDWHDPKDVEWWLAPGYGSPTPVEFKVLEILLKTRSSVFLEFQVFYDMIENLKWQFGEDINFVTFWKFVTLLVQNLRYQEFTKIVSQGTDNKLVCLPVSEVISVYTWLTRSPRHRVVAPGYRSPR